MPILTTEQFVSKVRYMRKLQKDYFRTRDGLILRQAKAIEKEVDEYLTSIPDKEQKPDPQQSLFN